jgi:tRNA-specific 2-thiouridylase
MSANTQTRVIVGMSGGVDSSVAALLLLEQGLHVEGLFMKNWEEDDGTEYCTAKEDLADAQAVCDKLGIRLHQANFASEYWDTVFEHFLAEYRAGRTPNPDILCNKEIKFKAFLEYALVLGADYIATGHYARIDHTALGARLLKGLDGNKDQSYFLHAVAEEQFKRSLFPLGEMTKSEVRALAFTNGLTTHDKKDSTGICFIGERRFKDFLEQYIPAQPGEIVSDTGETLGQHSGLMFHTLGQRQGLKIGGVKDHKEAPWYVIEKRLDTNQLVVAQGNDHPLLFSDSLRCDDIEWIDGEGPALPFSGQAKTRYRQHDQRCSVIREAGGYRVSFEDPQRSVTPGQSVCIYNDDWCLGGSVITSTERTGSAQSPGTLPEVPDRGDVS